MHPKIIRLLPQFRAERLDPYHRHEVLANALYAAWADYARDNTADETLTFNAWVSQHHNKPKKWEQVLYLTPSEQRFYTLRFTNSKAYLNDELLACERDKKGLTPFALTISLTEDVLVIPFTREDTKIRQHHSSTVAGNDVLFAGELFASNGTITSISDHSGHYRPDLYSLVYGLNCLLRNGADLRSTTIYVNSWSFANANYFEDGLLFVTLYTMGFDDPKYIGEFDTLGQAHEALKANPFQQNSYCYIKEKNELYEISLDSRGQLLTTSFTHKYQEQIQARTTVPETKKLRSAVARSLFD